MKIAVEGCAHGELENIYNTVELLEEKHGFKIDLLICCGDFQSSRNKEDLKCMAVPPKYWKICSFYKYYSGEKIAPILTIFIGGNHEASNYLQELPYGGWVAKNIYYMGYAGVINIAGLRIAGLSGIYKSRDYMRGHCEMVPYDENSKRTVYHVRNLEVFRLKQLTGKVDIFLSHDWPSEVFKYGNIKQLLKKKPHFREDVANNQLGSKPSEELLHHIKPTYWFAAHLHCKYAALVEHEDKSVTKFLALDKCLPKRRFLQIVDMPEVTESKMEISYDAEWLAILYLTNHLLSVKNVITYMPGPGGNQRYNFTPTEEEKKHVLARFNNCLLVPNNFCRTAPAYEENGPNLAQFQTIEAKKNPQTVLFCETLGIDDPLTLVSELQGTSLSVSLEQSFCDSFIDDTIDDESFFSISSSPLRKLCNLSLPDPKLDSSEEIQSDKVNSIEEPESDTPLSSDNVTATLTKDEETMVVCDSPTPRKLKRRNEELYKNEEKDDE